MQECKDCRISALCLSLGKSAALSLLYSKVAAEHDFPLLGFQTKFVTMTRGGRANLEKDLWRALGAMASKVPCYAFSGNVELMLHQAFVNDGVLCYFVFEDGTVIDAVPR